MDLNDPSVRSGIFVLALLGLVVVGCLAAWVYTLSRGSSRKGPPSRSA